MTDSEDSGIYYDFSCGISFQSSCFNDSKIINIIESVEDNQFEFLVVPLSRDKVENDKKKNNQFRPILVDTELSSSYLKSVIVGKVSKSIAQGLDSVDVDLRKSLEKLYHQEINYTSHLSLSAVILPTPISTVGSVNYSRKVYQSLTSNNFLKLWLKFKIDSENIAEQWSLWNNFRTRVNQHQRLFPVVQLEKWTKPIAEECLLQWFGEPLKAVLLPKSIFLMNQQGFPALSKAHQKFLKQSFHYNLQYIITGCQSNNAKELKPYYDYLRFLHQNQDPITESDRFEQSYLDYLQSPLQPLQDNLQSQTYEVFELDPVKYTNYQKATYLAILDLINERRLKDSLVIMVVGAGRGPLIQCTINAINRVDSKLLEGLKVKIYGVEKNPNAIHTLMSKKETLEDWKLLDIDIVDSDMRDFNPDHTADILVSELLGSFGDNELSPECLDGAQKYLNSQHGISIPTWYTSYLSPVQSQTLYQNVSNYVESQSRLDKAYETGYVVKPHLYHVLSPSQALFTFHHPNRETPIDNSRFGTLNFPISQNSLLHGFLGYFDCCLYKDVHISTNPKNFSTGMFSWFPIFFPIKQSVQLNSNSSVTCHFWRCVSKSKVWYEWTISSPISIEIHNIQGEKSSIGLI
ncbi:protein arginine methyltransferase [Tieghemostelium lacteum]|uniref:Protein arginine N-methyltransferase n=1 Tax=Tieghemostelium lacteum TaxID=361077 RepID=A0A151ZBI2_TIELA|nr:protein arginine methyltransferase [Tieghemostelium lacteum]|eukprot:KYQ91299.1 protein arginine methyltransferase [Tieghemostelium lacteum]